MLNIIVCLKQVPDPEAPPSVYRVEPDNKHISCRGAPPVISTYDENALEAALRLKDHFDCRVTAISAGKSLSKAVLRKSLAAGADALVLLDNSAFADMDSHATAISLTEAIKKIGKFDLIMTGIQAADTNAGIVGPGIAELLDIPFINNVRKISVNGSFIVVESLLPDGYRIVQVPMPVLVTVNKSLGDLRMATTAALMEAQKREITMWSPDDLQIQPSDLDKTHLLKIYIPRHESNVEMIHGNSQEEKGINLALKLLSQGIIKK